MFCSYQRNKTANKAAGTGHSLRRAAQPERKTTRQGGLVAKRLKYGSYARSAQGCRLRQMEVGV